MIESENSYPTKIPLLLIRIIIILIIIIIIIIIIITSITLLNTNVWSKTLLGIRKPFLDGSLKESYHT